MVVWGIMGLKANAIDDDEVDAEPTKPRTKKLLIGYSTSPQQKMMMMMKEYSIYNILSHTHGDTGGSTKANRCFGMGIRRVSCCRLFL